LPDRAPLARACALASPWLGTDGAKAASGTPGWRASQPDRLNGGQKLWGEETTDAVMVASLAPLS